MDKATFQALTMCLSALQLELTKLEALRLPFILEYDATDAELRSLTYHGKRFAWGVVDKNDFIKAISADFPQMNLSRIQVLVNAWIERELPYFHEWLRLTLANK